MIGNGSDRSQNVLHAAMSEGQRAQEQSANQNPRYQQHQLFHVCLLEVIHRDFEAGFPAGPPFRNSCSSFSSLRSASLFGLKRSMSRSSSAVRLGRWRMNTTSFQLSRSLSVPGSPHAGMPV